MLALDVILVALGVPTLLATAYLALLALLSRRPTPPPAPAAGARFDVLVPAHDEEAGIATTVQSLLALHYPRALYRVIVVADNCSDATATRARAAGAEVLVRQDPARRGKGYALQHGFDHSLAFGFADAVVVVDADTTVSPNLLAAFAARLERGALAVQAHYGVRNPGASWRTRLMAVAFALFHGVRSRGRERLGCSAGLRGNGMCFTAGLLEQVPHEAFSLVEDVEYGVRLGLHGHRVHYAEEAVVLGEMPSGGKAAGSQRRRWEGGRLRLARQHGAALLRAGLRGGGDRVALDLALDLFVPPLSLLSAVVLLGGLTSAAAAVAAGRPLLAAWVWAAQGAALTMYVLRGWSISGTGLGGLEALLHAPLYVAWRFLLAVSRIPRVQAQAWVRTAREESP